ncbi:MAG: hypothetical protein FWF92_05935 [Oscillospiraceae bacterium]|nr:hypothetical protein [Oscillospiraceae bacterium]
MKKIIIVLWISIVLMNFSSCTNENQEYNYTIKDALKISAYLFDESVNMNEPIYYDFGITEYNLERLKINDARIMAPQGEMCTLETGGVISPFGLVLFLEFDGIIKVMCENEDVRLERSGISDYEMQLAIEGYVSAYPLRVKKFNENDFATISEFIPGTEYYLNVNAYRFDNEESPIIRAQLKLVALEDAMCDDVENFWNDGKPSSRCVSIELISYEYSDVYIILDEIWDDDDDE